MERISRGDIVVVSAPGDYGKPRPAVVVQNDSLIADHSSLLICQMTSSLELDADFRIPVQPDAGNGLQFPSQIMVEKIIAVNRRRIGRRIGRLNSSQVRELNAVLVFVLALDS